MKKLKKLIRRPGLFWRDYLIQRHPIILNEIHCPQQDEAILLRHDLAMESQLSIDFAVDVVFTWVDDQDADWQTHYQHARQNWLGPLLGRHGADPARFSNHDELRYSLHSVLNFLPWVRRVHIVTAGQCPDWLVTTDRVRIVDHQQLIDQQFLPTFNSHVIEAHLHRIPDLAEHFIYFNDDVFVARPLPAGHFFRSNGLAALFLSGKSLQAMRARGTDTPTLSASHAVAALLLRDFDYIIDQPLVHSYVPLRKSVFEQAWRQYQPEIQAFLPHRFRTAGDLNLATCLVPWLAYLQGAAVTARDICHYFNLRSPAAVDHFRALLHSQRNGAQPHSFCVNDVQAIHDAQPSAQPHLQIALQQYFNY